MVFGGCNPAISVAQREETFFNWLKTISQNATALRTTGTPQYEAFRWLLDIDPARLCPGSSTAEEKRMIQERYTLALLYFSTNGNNWNVCTSDPTKSICPADIVSDRWLTSGSVCGWFNVTCTPQGRVEAIILQNNLDGTIPRELGFLSDLTVLLLEGNRLKGDVPFELGLAKNLIQLDVSENELTGMIPPALFESTLNLRFLGLRRNAFVGDIPSEISNLSFLDTLELDGNKFGGPLPTALGDLASVRFLTLNGNGYTGTIPAQYDGLESLRQVNFQQNQLEGSLPNFFGDMTSLESINFSDNLLSGSIPSQLRKLEKLEELFLHRNNFTGEMPLAICSLREGNGNLQTLTADCGSNGNNNNNLPPNVLCSCCTVCFS